MCPVQEGHRGREEILWDCNIYRLHSGQSFRTHTNSVHWLSMETRGTTHAPVLWIDCHIQDMRSYTKLSAWLFLVLWFHFRSSSLSVPWSQTVREKLAEETRKSTWRTKIEKKKHSGFLLSSEKWYLYTPDKKVVTWLKLSKQIKSSSNWSDLFVCFVSVNRNYLLDKKYLLRFPLCLVTLDYFLLFSLLSVWMYCI